MFEFRTDNTALYNSLYDLLTMSHCILSFVFTFDFYSVQSRCNLVVHSIVRIYCNMFISKNCVLHLLRNIW